jgi:hypothetical protein
MLEGIEMENVGIVCDNLEYTTAIWYIIWPFGNLVASWHVFSRLGILFHEKSGSPKLLSLFLPATPIHRKHSKKTWLVIAQINAPLDTLLMESRRGPEAARGHGRGCGHHADFRIADRQNVERRYVYWLCRPYSNQW